MLHVSSRSKAKINSGSTISRIRVLKQITLDHGLLTVAEIKKNSS